MTADTVATLGYEISAKLDTVLECKPGEIGKGARIALLILADKGRDPKKEPLARQELEAYLNALSEFEKEHPVFSTFMCRTLGFIGVAVKNTVGYWAYLASKEIDGFQSRWGRGLNPENPTHSQLSKDHDDHPLHVIAAECAAEASQTVGAAMAQAWAGKKTLAEVQDTALSYFFHPERVCLFAAGDTVPDAQVLFSKNSAALDAKDKQVLAQVKDILDGDSALVVDIWAYANDGGSLAADRKLSSRRGDAVRDYLVNDLKVPRSQIGTVVPGSTGPSVLDSYQTDEAQAARGRRVEFRVVKAGGGTQSQRSIMHKIETWSKQPTNQKAIKQAGSEEWAWGQVKKVEEELKKLNKAQKDPWGAAVEFYKQLEKLREDADAKKLKEGAKKVGEGAKDVAEGAKRKYEAAKEDAKVIKDKELPSAKKKAEEVGKKALDAEEPVPGAKQTQKALEGVLGEKK